MLDSISINAHSSIRIASGKVLYFDPFHITAESHDADVIFVTHDHYDHFSPEDIAKIIKEDTVFVAPKSTSGLIRETFSGFDVTEVAPGDAFSVAGIEGEAVAAYNPAKKFHPKKEEWVGYVVTVDGLRHYICGDMDETEESRNVKCDVLLLPIGGTYTMDVPQAVELTAKLSPKYAVPTHYGDIVGKASDGSAFAEEIEKKGIPTQVVLKI